MPKHSTVPDQCVHQRVLERVAHVQAASHIGGRDDDRVGRAYAAGCEIIIGFPIRVQRLLNRVWVELIIHYWCFEIP